MTVFEQMTPQELLRCVERIDPQDCPPCISEWVEEQKCTATHQMVLALLPVGLVCMIASEAPITIDDIREALVNASQDETRVYQ